MTDDILSEIVDYLEQAHKYDDYVASLCPFHDDSRPSFIVHADTYSCKSCGAFGKTENLLSKLSHTNIIVQTPTTFHNPWNRWLAQDQSIEKVLIRSWQFLTQHPHFGTYMQDRGFTSQELSNFGIGYRENWITFPIRNTLNTVIGAVARAGQDNDSPSKYVVPSKQAPNLLYIPSINLIKKGTVIYLTFGIIDAFSLMVCGIPSASTTNGKHISASALNEFRKRIIILPDRGEEKEALQLASRLDWRGQVKRMDYPENCKDPNDIMRYCGRDTLKNLLT